MITPKATPAVVTIYPTAWTRIAGGSNHTCGVRSTGVYCWGDNTIYGMHGDGSCTTSIRWSPPGTIVPGSSGATDVAAGLWFNCMVTAAGGVQCWGIRRDGRMGDAGAIGDLCQPSPIGVVLPVGFIAADVEIGTDHACALSTGGVAACWGDNEYGQLGDGTRVDRNTAQVVGGALTWAQISAGVDHTCGRTTAGRIYCWGRDTYGEIGNGIATDALGYVAPQAVGAATNWIDIASGDDHVCALNSTSDVYCWGRNAQGQLGLGDTTNRDTPILVPTI